MSQVLAVDLDGTLVRSDMLHETFWSALGSKGLGAVAAGFQGRAALKAALSEAGDFDPETLPFNDAVLDEIRARKAEGARVVLATASHSEVAERIADHLGLFDEVLASDGHQNLKGREKARVLTDRYGENGFAYIGDSTADLPVWKAAAEAVSVDASPSLKGRIDALGRPAKHLSTEGEGLVKPMLKALRPHQWLKNMLIFIPLLLAHRLEVATVFPALLAFVAFCLTASSVYVTNDLLDLSADRAHPRKRHRPFASGALPITWGIGLSGGLLLAGLAIGAFVGPVFLLVLAFYYLCTLAYSLFLKRQTVIDICMLAGLYTLRIIAGGAATGIVLSVWLLGFSIFFFLALAAVKRQAELVDVVAAGRGTAAGRGYLPEDLPLIAMMALASGYVSVLVAGLYLTSTEVAELYSFPSALWGICAVLIYWLSRAVMLAHRGRMTDDPIVFAVTDKVSLFCGAGIVGLVVLAARYSP